MDAQHAFRVPPVPLHTVPTLRIDLEFLEILKRRAGIRSNHELARLIGIDPSTFSRIVNGKTSPGLSTVVAMVNQFGTGIFPFLFIVEERARNAA